MKYLPTAALATVLLAPWGLSQAIELSRDLSLYLDAGVYSDYRTRGISQTQNDPALQGSATLSHSSGLYAGVWSSNVDFGLGSKTRQEIDYYAGYNWQINDDISLDTAYFQYEYPRQSALNYGEYFSQLSAYGAKLGAYYSDNLGGDQSYLYSYVGYGTQLPADVTLDLRYGQVDLKDPLLLDGSGDTRDSYDEWQIKLSKELLGLNWSASYVDTDLGDSECSNYMGFDDVCAATLVLGVNRSF
ncbi:TorF family putative porin [Pseudomonas sp. J452]|uniref:TorF family putative porin n=1 Tax=Pseudomonas sp. J452 TaxID=2898441 RepID=UPI0021ADCCF9|nr:TorF family putative porin [Pseudomonas sp. J452]UUY08023.1 TorF family putative porin [Pseudomonas sp. J452]